MLKSNKSQLVILLLTNLISISSLIYSTLYMANINDVFDLTQNENERKYLKLKNVYSEPIFNLHLIILTIDILYLLIFLILNNKTISEYLGLNINKIATQSTIGYSNMFLELFFMFLIKAASLVLSLFFNSLSYCEISIIREEDKKKLDMLNISKSNLNILFWIDISSLVLFIFLYLLKLIRIKRIINKGNNERINLKNNFIAIKS